jgi:hypothetical protein
MRDRFGPNFTRLAAPPWAAASALALLLTLAVGPSAAPGAEPVAGEYDLKAAFVYQFTHYTEWPAESFEDSTSPIVVAVVGEDPFRGALERAVRDKTVGGRSLAYRHFANANALEPCHVLYVSPSERQQLGQIVRDAQDFAALTVADTEDFTREGGMVRFLTENKKVRFEIRRKAVEAAGLRIKAQLLKAGHIYQERP